MTMDALKLSFCMPTYNYGPYIGAAIASILRQEEPGIEVVVLDSGSTDGTREIVEELTVRHREIRYVWQGERGGIDRDLARCVELAKGEYCWLLSADDALGEGSVRRIMSEMSSGSDILLCNRVWCDGNLKPVQPEEWLEKGTTDRVVQLAKKDEVGRYLADARSLGALFSFMSSIVVRREAWMRADSDTSLVGSHYAHVQRLFSIGQGGGRLKYIADPLVLCRGGADSFREDGLAQRLLIDLHGFLKLADALFANDPPLRSAFIAVLRREHPWKRWVRVRAEARDLPQWREVSKTLTEVGFPRGMIVTAAIAGIVFGLSTRLLRKSNGQ